MQFIICYFIDDQFIFSYFGIFMYFLIHFRFLAHLKCPFCPSGQAKSTNLNPLQPSLTQNVHGARSLSPRRRNRLLRLAADRRR